MPPKNHIDNIRKTLDLAGEELKILHQISHSISSSLDLDKVFKQIIELVVQVTRCDSCLLYLLEENKPYLFLRASKNPHPRLIGRIAVKVGEGITGWVAETSEPVAISKNASKDPRFRVFSNLPEDRYESFLSVPIIAPTERVTGVINVQHRKPHRHSERQKTLISIIGHQVGGAIENARLYEETKRQTQAAVHTVAGQPTCSVGEVPGRDAATDRKPDGRGRCKHVSARSCWWTRRRMSSS